MTDLRALLAPFHADLSRLLAAIEAVSGLHTREVIATHEGYGEEAWCPYCCDHWPCETITALAAALGSDTIN